MKMIVVIVVILIVICIIVFFLLNSLYKSSVAYRNANIANAKYKEGISDKLKFVNFGSTYAMYAFNSYDELRLNAFNFSLDAQSLEIDERLLRKYASYIASDATVVFCLAACVTYYRYSMVTDKSKYYVFMGRKEIPDYSLIKAIRCYFPLTVDRLKSMIVTFIKGNEIRTIYSSYKSFPTHEAMINNMRGMADGWIKLFRLNDLKRKDDNPVNEENKRFNTQLLRSMFDFCLSKGWNPVVVIPPFSDILNQHFGEEFISNSLYEMISQASKGLQVEVLDYRLHQDFQHDYSSYLDGGFRLNKKGSIKFVKKLINDLNNKGYNLSNETIGY